MNIELLMDVLASVSDANKEQDVHEHLVQLHSSLQNTISAPSDSASKAFKSKYNEILNMLDNQPTNDTFPSHIKTINEIGGSDYLGRGLKNRLTNIFDENSLTPNIALDELDKINVEVEAFYNKISSIYNGLSDFNFSRPEIEQNYFQVLTTIPRKQIPDNLEALKTEFDSIDKIVRVISEVADGRGGSPKVVLISASEWQVLFELLPASSLLLIIVIEKIFNIFTTILKLKKSKDALVSYDTPQNIIDDLNKHIDTTVQHAIEELSDEIVDEYSKGSETNKSELKVKLKFGLKDLARRIDAGTTIEIHTASTVKPHELEEPKAPEKVEDMSDEDFQKLTEEYNLSLEEYNSNKSKYDQDMPAIEKLNEQIEIIKQKSAVVQKLQESHKEPLQLSFGVSEEDSTLSLYG